MGIAAHAKRYRFGMSKKFTSSHTSASGMARVLKVTTPTIIAWAKAGKIPVALHVGKTWRFDVRAVLEAVRFQPSR